ncbi:Clp protease ClpP [Paenibacillus sp. N4]|uniref:head maturation protease, ClpP-related n=1 Tax=Paenibacillus vietnamensis TaxID=2590547 RepID=UPI001CD065B5|nr:head maturation protease, ClpP-related [Paenibacillus vietnamensis]MCA0754913.1 Clp protease ClpP [Paenibacillus vietnamensis]
MKTVNIKGVIVGDDEKWIYDWFGIAAVSPSSVNKELKDANGEDVDVIINSGGGSVFAGSEIYSALKGYAGRVTARVVGLAASAASVAAMAADVVSISPTAQIMIHNAWTRMEGDYRDMEHGAEFLKNTNSSIANAYRLKTKKSEDELKAMMDKETWLTAQQAVKEGFADEIMFDEQKQLAASAAINGMLPLEVVNKMRLALADNGGQLSPVALQQPASPIAQTSTPPPDPEPEAEPEAETEEEKQKAAMALKIKLINLKGAMVEDDE